jgi:hypothetical protein
MRPFHALLLLAVLATLVAFAFVVRWERARYDKLGKVSGWRRVRLASIPIALLVAALVWLPAQATTGMEGLAVFYMLLLVAAPLAWFGLHWVVGRFASPPLSLGESAAVAASPIAVGLVAVYVAHALQTPVWQLLRSLGLA